MYTQGKWKVVIGAVYTEDDRPIATMVRDETALKAGIMPVECDENARLISQAPELLRALEMMIDWTEVSIMYLLKNRELLPEGYEGALNIIRKAKGE